MKHRTQILFYLLALGILVSCSKGKVKETEEQVAVVAEGGYEVTNDSMLNTIIGNATMKQVPTFPNKVILTGLGNHRLVSIYKSKPGVEPIIKVADYSYEEGENGDESSEYFMPGITILYGYNLLNIAHYDLTTEKGNLLFNHPVLIKTLYYPSFEQDSLDNQPINRDYYMVSVYDEDTNKDSLINKWDLRRFYHFNANGNNKTLLIPADYSALRSQYDSKNDLMYIFARKDENKNGIPEKKEPVHVFWFSLKNPQIAKMLY